MQPPTTVQPRIAAFLDEGGDLAPDTSHPTFVAMAPPDFYDASDDFAPFGNDDGNDALRLLEHYYEDGGVDATVVSFACEVEADWDYPVPDSTWEAAPAAVLSWLADDTMNDSWLGGLARARVALALGQLKIRGFIDTDLRSRAEAGVRAQRLMLDHAAIAYPGWGWAAHAAAALDRVEGALLRAPSVADG